VMRCGFMHATEESVETTTLLLPGESRRVMGGTIIPASTTQSEETVWFSLPTISSERPRQRHGSCDSALIMHEDEWRQCEFFPECNISHVQEMVGFLRDHEVQIGGPAGFRELYIRADLPTPISTLSLSFSGLRDSLKCASPLGGVAMGPMAGTPQLVAGGFAVNLPGGGRVYGRAVDDHIVSVSAVFIHGQDNPTHEAVIQLAAYATQGFDTTVRWGMSICLQESATITDSRHFAGAALSCPAGVQRLDTCLESVVTEGGRLECASPLGTGQTPAGVGSARQGDPGSRTTSARE
jgi:hypothetical protein